MTAPSQAEIRFVIKLFLAVLLCSAPLRAFLYIVIFSITILISLPSKIVNYQLLSLTTILTHINLKQVIFELWYIRLFKCFFVNVTDLNFNLHMGIIDDELSEIKKLCEQKIKGSRLVSCVRYMVRVEIKCTAFKTIVSCMQFTNNYPETPILIELKSKTLSEKLLNGLTIVCEQETKKILGKPQILTVLVFLRNFIDENPLCCCYDEINALKTKLSDPTDVMKLKQKSSQIVIRIRNGNYFNNFKLQVPDKYPDESVVIESVETNFPPAFYRHMLHQAKEIARKCVEPPARKNNNAVFKASVSLLKVSEFLIDCIKRLPYENCQYCGEVCFTDDPKDLELNENGPKHIERIYCSHLYHMECLFKYMKTPPFGNKKCHTCSSPIYHHKWTLSDKLAENRWAHEKAKERELAEVQDFFT